MNDTSEATETKNGDGKVVIDRSALVTLIGLSKTVVAYAMDYVGDNHDAQSAKLATDALGSFATMVQVAHGIDDGDAAMHAAASARIFEMAAKAKEGGAK